MNNKWWLTLSIFLSFFFSQSHAMEETKSFENETQSNLSNLLVELKIPMIEYHVADYINQNLDLTDLANLEKNLCNLVKDFPKYIKHNLPWNLINREFYTISSATILHSYFKYFLTLKLTELDLETRKKLLETIKMDKQCSALIVVLLIISTLENSIRSLRNFDKVYKLIKHALATRALYLCRSLKKEGNLFATDFHCLGILNFDPSKFEDITLLEILIKNKHLSDIEFNHVIDGNTEYSFDIYELLFCLRSDLKNQLLEQLKKDSHFKKKYLNTELAKAIYEQDLNEVKNLLSNTDINKECAPNGFTPIMLAIIFEAKDILIYLINNNASLDTPNNFGRNALYYAVTNNNAEIIILLMTFSHKSDLFIASISTNNIELFRTLKQELFNFSESNHYPLLTMACIALAAQRNRALILEELILMRSNMNIDEVFKRAVENNSIDVVKFLKDKISNSLIPLFPIFDIIDAADLFKIKLLLNMGFDVNDMRRGRKSPIKYAKEYGYDEMVELLKLHKKNSLSESESLEEAVSLEEPKRRCIIS